MLTKTAVPTLFSFNKEPTKRRSSERRQEVSTKRRHVEDAFETNYQVELLEQEEHLLENSKECQTNSTTKSVSTQTYFVTTVHQMTQTQQAFGNYFISETSSCASQTYADGDTSFVLEEASDITDSDEFQSQTKYQLGMFSLFIGLACRFFYKTVFIVTPNHLSRRLPRKDLHFLSILNV